VFVFIAPEFQFIKAFSGVLECQPSCVLSCHGGGHVFFECYQIFVIVNEEVLRIVLGQLLVLYLHYQFRVLVIEIEDVIREHLKQHPAPRFFHVGPEGMLVDGLVFGPSGEFAQLLAHVSH